MRAEPLFTPAPAFISDYHLGETGVITSPLLRMENNKVCGCHDMTRDT